MRKYWMLAVTLFVITGIVGGCRAWRARSEAAFIQDLRFATSTEWKVVAVSRGRHETLGSCNGSKDFDYPVIPSNFKWATVILESEKPHHTVRISVQPPHPQVNDYFKLKPGQVVMFGHDESMAHLPASMGVIGATTRTSNPTFYHLRLLPNPR